MRLTIKKSINDEEIIAGCLKSKREDQHALYEKYSAKMLGVCCRYLKNPEEAEDLMISSIMKVFEKLEQYKAEGSFEGWIRRIVINECLTHLRKNKSMYMAVDVENAEREPDYKLLSDRLVEEDMINLIQGLPDGYRTVFNLYAIEGYSHKEIAENLGININTSKSQLSRARALLQLRLIEAEKIVDQKIVDQ
ncbi:MAG: RNA polymerase sigma factor [Bacteroidetes bacterium]|nr:RNA polymerase sigma factor [Bacteroidota bacterium]MDA1122162.1 RNA polymerase sigma factor [Bacteroidota bacterium]